MTSLEVATGVVVGAVDVWVGAGVDEQAVRADRVANRRASKTRIVYFPLFTVSS